MKERCELVKQGYSIGKCLVYRGDEKGHACEITLKDEGGVPYRLIQSAHLSRPEHYLSIYQSGCNMECLKCHSWEFSQHASGTWLSPDDILNIAAEYAETITCHEPRERATSYHALDLCRGCGICVEADMVDLLTADSERNIVHLKPTGKRGERCPGRITPEQIVLSPQGIGPARNILAFTGGDLGCRPEFYARCAEKIRERGLPLWILFETNGYGLTPLNLNRLQEAGIDSFWLDIKAFDEAVHKELTGVSNERILQLPGEMIAQDFVLEVLSLYIPGWVEEDQLRRVAELIAGVDPDIPFTILAFFPEYRMKDVPPPTVQQMLNAYREAREAGLRQVRLANLGVFITTEADYALLMEEAGDAI